MPFISAEDGSEDYSLELIISDTNLEKWYSESDILTISSSLINIGDSITIENDPSCEVFYSVKDLDLEAVFDNSNLCRGQNQDLTIDNNEVIVFDDMFWDFTDFDGNLVSSGTYTISLTHSSTDINENIEIYFQRDIEFDSNLELELNQVNFGGTENDAGHHLVGITLSNPTTEIISLQTDESCRLISSVNGVKDLSESCYGGNLLLHPYEKSYLGNILIPQNSLLDGVNLIQVNSPGNALYQEIEIQHEANSELSSKVLDPGIEVSITKELAMEKEHISFLSYSINLKNLEQQQVDLSFSNTCKFQMFVINDLGEKIVDTTTSQNCQEIQTYHSLTQGEVLTFDLPDWYLEDGLKCSIDSGTYAVILEIGEYSTTVIENYEHIDNYRSVDCIKNDVFFESNYNIIDDSLYSTITISSLQEILKINEPCIIGLSLESEENDKFENTNLEICDFNTGNYFYLPNLENDILQTINFEHQILLIHNSNESLPSLELSLIAEHTLQSGGIAYHNFTYISDSDEEINLDLTWDVEGFWTNIGLDDADCWMLSNEESSMLLLDSKQISYWSPNNNWNGEYLVSESNLVNLQCQFDLQGIEVISIYSEQKITPTAEEVQIKDEQESFIQQPSPELTTTVIVLVSTSSIFAILGLFVANTESLRIPTTAAGLWLLGLLGKTQETSDGRFQRGRLMGYLTANPGCHFRALMAALNMSNGQITHHLRLLESQELIWRLKDGRLVRYYPLNNSLYPGMNPDELPIPLLSPDPNSLQGKILSLLDDEHQYGKFPTQAELAHKLEKSQQLISHHLRTLQKFGLVEKRKMGIKNRYKLTKEALFLLETDIDFKVKE